jgi:multicomponent Na+:H+ antiporter subunit D
VLAAGIALAFLTGDLFNLFVAFEVFLVASYVLLTLNGGNEQVRAA